jgi:hypothetical protein
MAPSARSASANQKPSWITLAEAAAFLCIDVVTLRRSLERNTRKNADGATLAHVDGVTARKLGRHWRVWLDAAWLNPPTPQK